MAQVFTGAAVFDGIALYPDASLRVQDGRVTAAGPGEEVGLDGGMLAPGFVDLQVNGGGGRMVDGDIDAAGLAAICDVHARLGATSILPTLITDTPEATASVIRAGVEAARQRVPGFLGLHLEGPHLDPRRHGAHDPRLIRPMTDGDLDLLLTAASALPRLMVTLAPEAATNAQIARLAAAGAIVSLGHSDCSFAVAKAAIAAGVRAITHLFNAMSQMTSRAPGLVGAGLAGLAPAGVIADGVHVAPETLAIAMAANPGGLFLVSDSMALAGTKLTGFTLQGRSIQRRDGRLALDDGTLAGADLDPPGAVRVLIGLGVPVATALGMATSRPAAVMGLSESLGQLVPGRVADMVHLGADGSLKAVWRAGVRLV
jgi:N-acetylglucosamine-6-phosphate deacetylase